MSRRCAAHAERHDVALRPDWDAGEIVLELYEKLVEHTLVQPTFVRDYPVAVRPLARPHRDDPRLAEAWDLIIGGVEIAPAYSELADPVEQRRRLVEQSLAAAKGDPEAMELDEDFLRALEYGMPPTGGMGMGVDRLVMMLTGKGIRETILFPLLKPDSKTAREYAGRRPRIRDHPRAMAYACTRRIRAFAQWRRPGLWRSGTR